MNRKLRLGMLAFAACATLAASSGVAGADEVPLITGDQWTRSSEQLKKAYLIGIANTLQVEAAYQAASPPADDQSLIPRFGKGLRGQTLDSVREAVNNWCARHPDSLQQPVLETIWFEIVRPGLQ